MESTVQLNWAFSNKRQSAYATALANGDVDQSHPFEGADIADHVPNMSDNAAQFGKGHEFATRNDILSWDVRFRRSFQATTKMLGWAFAFHLGKVTTTNPTGSVYQHVMEYQDPLGTGYYGSGRQQPVTTIIEGVHSDMSRKFPSCQVMAVEVTGQLNDWVRMAVEVIGSGKRDYIDPVSGFTFPTSTEGTLLRHASLLFEHGTNGGSQLDESCDVRSFRFRTEMQYDEVAGYCPGSGYQTSGDPTSGQIRNKLEFTRRACLLEMVVNAKVDSAIHTRLEAGTLLSAKLTIEGATITGAHKHQLIINVPSLKYRSAVIGSDGDTITYSLATVVFYDASLANPFEITVKNTTATYLAT